MATIQEVEERIERQKAELQKLEEKKKELKRKIRERDRKWREQVLLYAGERLLSTCGCPWQELDLAALDDFLSSYAKEASSLVTLPGSTPEDAKARLDALKKPANGATKDAAEA